MKKEESDKPKEVIGRLEKVTLPEFNIYDIEAKVDTGAYNSSIHTGLIEAFEKDDKDYIRFKILDEDHKHFQDTWYETDQFETKYIKSSSGHNELRYIIKTIINIKDREIKIKLSLSNRKEMRYPILLGRKLMKKHFIIDVSQTFTDTN